MGSHLRGVLCGGEDDGRRCLYEPKGTTECQKPPGWLRRQQLSQHLDLRPLASESVNQWIQAAFETPAWETLGSSPLKCTCWLGAVPKPEQ